MKIIIVHMLHAHWSSYLETLEADTTRKHCKF